MAPMLPYSSEVRGTASRQDPEPWCRYIVLNVQFHLARHTQSFWWYYLVCFCQPRKARKKGSISEWMTMGSSNLTWTTPKKQGGFAIPFFHYLFDKYSCKRFYYCPLPHIALSSLRHWEIPYHSMPLWRPADQFYLRKHLVDIVRLVVFVSWVFY